jgi:hypothetical protein
MDDKPVVRRPGNPNWKPGISGNPAGRPKKGETMTDALRAKIDKDEIADVLISMARAGNVSAVKYVYDRIDGMPRQHVEMSNDKDTEWLEYLRGSGTKPEAVGDTRALPSGEAEASDT